MPATPPDNPLTNTHLLPPRAGLETDRRAVMAGIAALAAGLALGACQRQDRRPGEIIVGSSATGVPFSFIDPWTNELTGSMVDTARAIAGAIGLVADLRIVPFSALIPSLTAGKIDMIAAAILRTPERAGIVAFSDPVYAYGGGLVVPASDPTPWPDLAALRGKRVGAQVGTRFIDQVREAGVRDVPTYDNLSDMLRDLGHGRIDAAYGDEPILRYQLRTGARKGLRLVAEFRAPAKEELCLVLRKGDPLLPRINAAIAVLQRDAIPAIVKQWGLNDS